MLDVQVFPAQIPSTILSGGGKAWTTAEDVCRLKACLCYAGAERFASGEPVWAADTGRGLSRAGRGAAEGSLLTRLHSSHTSERQR